MRWPLPQPWQNVGLRDARNPIRATRRFQDQPYRHAGHNRGGHSGFRNACLNVCTPRVLVEHCVFQPKASLSPSPTLARPLSWIKRPTAPQPNSSPSPAAEQRRCNRPGPVPSHCSVTQQGRPQPAGCRSAERTSAVSLQCNRPGWPLCRGWCVADSVHYRIMDTIGVACDEGTEAAGLV